VPPVPGKRSLIAVLAYVVIGAVLVAVGLFAAVRQLRILARSGHNPWRAIPTPAGQSFRLSLYSVTTGLILLGGLRGWTSLWLAVSLAVAVIIWDRVIWLRTRPRSRTG
jgi:hypothetical protein